MTLLQAKRVYRMLRFGQDSVNIGEAAYELRFRYQRVAGLAAAAMALGYKARRAARRSWPAHSPSLFGALPC